MGARPHSRRRPADRRPAQVRPGCAASRPDGRNRDGDRPHRSMPRRSRQWARACAQTFRDWHLRALLPLAAAELAALIAAVTTAVARGARCLRVHTDCQELIHLWQDRRGDDRLSTLQDAAFRLRRLQLRLIPRRFNQSANALARDAAQNVSSLPDDDGRLLSKVPPLSGLSRTTEIGPGGARCRRQTLPPLGMAQNCAKLGPSS
jgi:hypothetical protein